MILGLAALAMAEEVTLVIMMIIATKEKPCKKYFVAGLLYPVDHLQCLD